MRCHARCGADQSHAEKVITTHRGAVIAPCVREWLARQTPSRTDPRLARGLMMEPSVDGMRGIDMAMAILGTGKHVPVFVAVDHRRGTSAWICMPLREACTSKPLARKCCGRCPSATIMGRSTSAMTSKTRLLGRGSNRRCSSFSLSDSSARSRNLFGLKIYPCIKKLQRPFQRFKKEYNETWLIWYHGGFSPERSKREMMYKIQTDA